MIHLRGFFTVSKLKAAFNVLTLDSYELVLLVLVLWVHRVCWQKL